MPLPYAVTPLPCPLSPLYARPSMYVALPSPPRDPARPYVCMR